MHRDRRPRQTDATFLIGQQLDQSGIGQRLHVLLCGIARGKPEGLRDLGQTGRDACLGLLLQERQHGGTLGEAMASGRGSRTGQGVHLYTYRSQQARPAC